MPIKKRGDTTPPPTYHDYRAFRWGNIDREHFSYQGSQWTLPDGGDYPMEPTDVVLQPKISLLLKDIWHCGSLGMAKMVAMDILHYEDVTYLQLRGNWVWVEWNHHGKSHNLPGQKEEDRSVYRGRR